jgi:hypothetical protein
LTETARTALRAPVISLTSQIVGIGQLVLIILRAGTNAATDAYFYLFNLGMVPISCIVVGMMYPALLNKTRMSRRGLGRIRWITPLLSVAFVAGGSLWLGSHGRLGVNLLGVALFSALNALVQALLWYRAVAAEASGNAFWISGVALPANVLALVALIYPWPTPALAMTAMTGALVAGNLGLLALLRLRRVGSSVIESAPLNSTSAGGPFWFLSLASLQFIGQTFLQSLAVLLPPSTITLLNIGYKIVGSVSATFVNASMPLLVHQDTDSPRAARRFLRIVVVVVAAGGIAIALGTWMVRPELLAPAVIIAMWLITSSASAVAMRMSFRFLAPQAVARTMTVLIAVVALAVVSSHGAGFSLVVLLCAYAAIDGASAMLLLWPLRDRVMSLVLAATLTALAVGWTSSYL